MIYSTFLNRIIASIIDWTILTLISIGIIMLLETQFSDQHIVFLLIPWLLFLTYFGIMHSSIGRGQTIGKRITGIQVVDYNCRFISLQQSFWRSFIYIFSIFIADFFLRPPYKYFFILFNTIGSFITFFDTLFFIFNFNTREVFHDYLSRTIVVNINRSLDISLNTTFTHTKKIVLGFLFLFAICISLWRIYYKREDDKQFKKEIQAFDKIKHLYHYQISKSEEGNAKIPSEYSLTLQIDEQYSLDTVGVLDIPPVKEALVQLLNSKNISNNDYSKLKLEVRQGYDYNVIKHNNHIKREYTINNLKSKIK